MKNKNKYPRILMLVENNCFPEDIRVFNEASTLTEAGYLVSVICPSKAKHPFHEVLNGIHVYRYPNYVFGNGLITFCIEFGYSLIAMFLLTFIVLLKPGFDIIHTANPPDIMVMIAAFYKIFGKKFIFDQHDLCPEIYLIKAKKTDKDNSLIYKILLKMEKISCKMADHIIAPNASYKKLQTERDGVQAENITIVRNGPDLESAIQIERDGRRDGKKTLLYMGIIASQDGVDYLVRSIYNLKYKLKRNDFICVIAGDGDALTAVKEQTIELKLTDSIIFPGFVERKNVASYLNSADICLAPEPSNDLNDRSTMIKILEYMSFGKPVVAFNLPEHKVSAQESALYAEPNNEEDFAQKIATLMDAPQKCNTMGLAGRKRIENELGWIHQKAHLLEAYKKIERNCRK